jgi:hypothetical protein
MEFFWIIQGFDDLLIFGHNVFVRIQVIFMNSCMPFNVIDKLP